MGLRLFFLPNFPGAMFIQGATFIPDSRVGIGMHLMPARSFIMQRKDREKVDRHDISPTPLSLPI